MKQKTAIIIGAGPAGLTAAYTLLKETDIHPIILEESDFIGGISRTAVYRNNRMDIGGHRFFSKSDAVTALWNELMPVQGAPAKDDKLLGRQKPLAEGGPDPETEDRVMLVRDRVSRIFYLGKFFDYPISLKPQTIANMGFRRTMQAGFGYIHAAIFKRKETSLEDFYINRFGKPLYGMFFEDYTEKLWGVHPSQISPEWGAQRVKGLSLMKAIFSVLLKPFQKDQKKQETSLIEQYIYPKKGPGQYWETMAQRILEMGGEIRMSEAVVGIETGENNAITAVHTNKGGQRATYPADVFFSSMAIKDLVAAMGEAVPANVREIAGGLPYRDFITVGLLLRKLKIQNQTQMKTVGNIVPDCWIYVQERNVRIGRLQIFNNWSPYMVDDLEHTVWIGLEYFCTEGDAMWNTPAEDFIRFATEELVKIGVIEQEDVLDATHIRVKKAYPAYFGTYAQFDKVRAYLDGWSNLYCIGRNGQHRYNNMDHSMMTAMEAVRLYKEGSSDRSAVWNVNTEEEYHEQKTAKA
ncbi:MAG: NAD(P)/FAD-dependent oxidoreductase [Eubacteriales bacterium]|nr:NAD(P)/FAD-dependent oxidoreductase [Eubacteriales bacterium]